MDKEKIFKLKLELSDLLKKQKTLENELKSKVDLCVDPSENVYLQRAHEKVLINNNRIES